MNKPLVNVNEDGKVYIKLLLWGCAGSGKTTAVDTLHKMAKEEDSESNLTPINDFKKIAMENGSTLYFDRGVFQSKSEKNLFYHIYTVAGQDRFFPLRKKIFYGTDGIILVFDSQRSNRDRNINSLKELKNICGEDLISKIPLLIMANKQDLPNTMRKEEIYQILDENNLIYPPDHKLNIWNPIVYETIALWDKKYNIYPLFAELVRRTTLYQLYDK
ncbi:hypothetical protein NEF87_005116 [Candidatus Lokiarchaeum ossiferum]|uniref:Small GTP-binding domain protein n=1 Tax=Candidatus Lokiarchaeum ossiferum TaxID=2951803 RepID=A0ABY6HZT2_9ARCH|nr:hypothetical protein NEF87_005116 [Candidatus Lokiarchaeum sp. B-35]